MKRVITYLLVGLLCCCKKPNTTREGIAVKVAGTSDYESIQQSLPISSDAAREIMIEWMDRKGISKPTKDVYILGSDSYFFPDRPRTIGLRMSGWVVNGRTGEISIRSSDEVIKLHSE